MQTAALHAADTPDLPHDGPIALPTGAHAAELLAGGDLGSRLVRLAHVAATLHRSQAAGLVAAVAEAEARWAGRDGAGGRA